MRIQLLGPNGRFAHVDHQIELGAHVVPFAAWSEDHETPTTRRAHAVLEAFAQIRHLFDHHRNPVHGRCARRLQHRIFRTTGDHRGCAINGQSLADGRQTEDSVFLASQKKKHALRLSPGRSSQDDGASEKVANERGLGSLVHVGWCTHLLEAARVHHGDAVGERHRLGLVVGHEQHTDLQALLNASKLQTHVLAQLRVEVGERFVEQEDVRVVNERTRKRDALLLPTAQEGRGSALQAAQTHDFQRLGHSALDLILGPPPQPEREGHILEHGEVRPDRVGLEHHPHVSLLWGQEAHVPASGDDAVVEKDLSVVRVLQPGDEAEGSTLAAAARAKQREDLSMPYGEAQSVDGGQVPKPPRHVAELEDDSVFGPKHVSRVYGGPDPKQDDRSEPERIGVPLRYHRATLDRPSSITARPGGELANPLRLVLVGAGRRGAAHLATLRGFTDLFEVVAVCDVYEENARVAADAHDAKAYGNIRTALNAERPDVALIVTPPESHHLMALEAARSGVHMLIETPLGTTRAMCDAIIESAQRAGVVVEVAENMRRQPQHQLNRRAIDAGLIGRVLRISTWYESIGQQGSYHQMSLLRFYAGAEGPEVQGFVRRFDLDAPPGELPSEELWTQAIVTFPNGVMGTCTYVSSWLTALRRGHPRFITIEGTRGFIVSGRTGHNVLTRVGDDGTQTSYAMVMDSERVNAGEQPLRFRFDTDPPLVVENPFAGRRISYADNFGMEDAYARAVELTSIHRAITTGAAPDYSLLEARTDQELSIAITESARLAGAPLRPPLGGPTEWEEQVHEEMARRYGGDPFADVDLLLDRQFTGGSRY